MVNKIVSIIYSLLQLDKEILRGIIQISSRACYRFNYYVCFMMYFTVQALKHRFQVFTSFEYEIVGFYKRTYSLTSWQVVMIKTVVDLNMIPTLWSGEVQCLERLSCYYEVAGSSPVTTIHDVSSSLNKELNSHRFNTVYSQERTREC